jgi:tetratricopeptide (TPR) repeat protein
MTVVKDPLVEAFRDGRLDEALRLAEEQIAGGAESAELHYLLGLIRCRLGQHGLGAEWLRRAVDANPANDSYRVMLVRSLVDAGRPEEALAAATRPRGISPPELALWHARAEAAQLSGDHEAAAEGWRVLCAARPSDWQAWSNVGQAFAALERWDAAADALGRASQLKPDDAKIRHNFAAALSRLGLHEESASEFQKLVDAAPANASLRLTLARLLADLGRSGEAMAQLDEAAALTVGAAAANEHGYVAMALGQNWREDVSGADVSLSQAEAVGDLALLFERTSRIDALRELLDEAEQADIGREQLAYPAAAVALRDGDAARARELLLAGKSATDAVRWHRLMSKIMDALGDPAAAFEEAKQMNCSVHDFDGWRERGRAYRARIRDLAASMSESWLGSLPQISDTAAGSPIFLVGFPRSGTTLLDTLLMGHPDLSVLEEVHMIGAAETALGGVGELPRKTIAELEQGRAAYLAELDRHLPGASPAQVVDKLPLNMMALPLIYSLFPNARIIFAQRHPCDAVLSGFMQSFVMNEAMACFLTIEDAADLYDAALDVFWRARSHLPQRIHTLVYEELVASPEASLRELVDFLGLEWDARMLDHRATAEARGTIITASYDQVIKPINDRASGRWRRYAGQLEPVLPTLLPWAERLGYTNPSSSA